MKNKEIFEKAFSHLTERYGNEYHTPDIRIINRFCHEKMLLEKSELYTRYLDLFGKISTAAERKSEHIAVNGTVGSSFIAYLLGATYINPLPRHEYCPQCHTVNFLGEGTPFDRAPTKCSCGEDIIVDGHDIPFESNLKSVLSNYIQLGVSYVFFEEAKRMICEEMRDCDIVILKNEEFAPTWFCFFEKTERDNGEYPLNGNAEGYSKFPRITLVPDKRLDRYKALETATGFQMKDIGYPEISFVYPFFFDGNIGDIPHFDNDFMRNIFSIVEPQSFDDLLKLIGFALGTNIWNNNGEHFFSNHRMSFREIPAYREDIYAMICEKLQKNGIYETGFAYEVAENARCGYYARHGGVDEDTMCSLLNLGFDMDFIFFLEEVNYMFPKAHGVAYLREAIHMMFYKLRYQKEYYDIIAGDSKNDRKRNMG